MCKKIPVYISDIPPTGPTPLASLSILGILYKDPVFPLLIQRPTFLRTSSLLPPINKLTASLTTIHIIHRAKQNIQIGEREREKMNGLDSPFEALPFNYLSYDAFTVIINNIWTWVAVLTAGGVSFFIRVRASSGSHSKSDPVYFCNPDSSKMVSPSSRSDCKVVESASTPVTAAREVENTDGVTRGKFLVYYYEEERENVSDGDECEERENGSCVNGDGDLDGHEGLRWRERIGEWEVGCYRYQDLTVLDGNVVRLWDSRRKIATLSSGGVMMY